MGFISDLASSKKGTASRARWREVFAQTDKEKESVFPPVRKPIPGGSYSRSNVSEPAAFMRLLQAMRSMAPGGWSDDRWEETKHYDSILYVCSHRKGEILSESEFAVYRKDINHPDGKVLVRPEDPPEGDRWVRPYDLVRLLEKPNRQDTWGDLMYRWNQQMDLTGKALTWMVPNQLGVPLELYSIPTAIAIPQPAINPDYPDGYYRIQPLYPYGPFSSYPTPATAVGAPIPAQWMMEFKFPHPLLRYDGYSPQTALRLELDEFHSISKSRWYKMLRTFNPEAVLNMKDVEGQQELPWQEIDRIKAEFFNQNQGPENAGRLYVAVNGEIKEYGTNPRDMDYPSGWSQILDFCMAGLGMSKSAAFMVDDTSYATLFATLKQLHLLTLNPNCNRIASHLTRTIGPFYGDDLIVEIRCKRIDDHDVNNAKIDKGIQGKCITKNEVRKLLDLPVTREEWGNELAGEEDKPEPQPGQPNPVAENPEETRGEEKEITKTREIPGNLNRGSLGPRKRLAKSLLRRNLVLNGNGKH